MLLYSWILVKARVHVEFIVLIRRSAAHHLQGLELDSSGLLHRFRQSLLVLHQQWLIAVLNVVDPVHSLLVDLILPIIDMLHVSVQIRHDLRFAGVLHGELRLLVRHLLILLVLKAVVYSLLLLIPCHLLLLTDLALLHLKILDQIACSIAAANDHGRSSTVLNLESCRGVRRRDG